ncbi:MAG: VCBS repeat-containing protein [Bacteroidota bacterium]
MEKQNVSHDADGYYLCPITVIQMNQTFLFLKRVHFLRFCILILFFVSCAPEPEKKEVVLYRQYCASCHIAPKIKELPKDIWKNSVLPDMLSRMDIEEMYTDPVQAKTAFRPKIKLADWVALENYIVSLAPEKLPENPKPILGKLSGFKPKTLQLDHDNGAFYTFLDYEAHTNTLVAGDVNGVIRRYHFQTKALDLLYKGKTPVTWYNDKGSFACVSEVGILDPSELERGKIVIKQGQDTIPIKETFHRPVHNLVEDLNGDGKMEMVVSEFGNETGRLSLMIQKDTFQYEKRLLLNQPGCIRTLARDMDKDGKRDLIIMTSQGNESITILYQKEDLSFFGEKVLEFSPVYGSSWFDLVDYNKDGFEDLITVNGDNADKSYVHKPYHGMRIHLNDGQNNFTETFFYPLHGATRFLADDFDQDGDMDFGIISTFPDYENGPERSFVYLENRDAGTYQFETKVLDEPNLGRWFLMDKGDIDSDGDIDILLSSFTYVFTPVPNELAKYWSENNTDVLILENTLN